MNNLYQDITYNFIDKLNEHNLVLSQFQALIDLYNQLPEEDRRRLWCAENDMVRREKRIMEQRAKDKENT